MSDEFRPGWLDNKQTPTEQEDKEAELIGGRRRKGSGSLWYAKGDCISEDYLVECKETSKDAYRLTVNDLQKIFDEAAQIDREPIFIVEFLKHGLKATMKVERS